MANAPEDLCKVKYVKDFGHGLKALGAVLMRDPDLTNYLPLATLMTLLPGGTDWNEDRYRPTKSPELAPRTEEMLKLAADIAAELGDPDAG
jgi:hypothetical protein